MKPVRGRPRTTRPGRDQRPGTKRVDTNRQAHSATDTDFVELRYGFPRLDRDTWPVLSMFLDADDVLPAADELRTRGAVVTIEWPDAWVTGS